MKTTELKKYIKVVLLFLLVLIGSSELCFSKSSSKKHSKYFNKKTNKKTKMARSEILVKYKSHAKESDIESFNSSKKCSIKKKITKMNLHRIKIPDNKTIEEMIEEYRSNPMVEYVEPNGMFQPYAVYPDDTLFSQQWGLDDVSDVDVDAPEAWEVEKGSSSIIVAVIDTGVDLIHEDLQNKLVAGYDVIYNDDTPQDDFGHGTHIAGIIAAETNNNTGVAGICWDTLIMPVKVMDYTGWGYISDLVEGIIWSVDNGARVLNLSCGAEGESQSLENAVNYAYDNGCVVVASMGSSEEESVRIPAAYKNTIAVGAINQSNERCDYADWGWNPIMAKPGGSTYGNHIDIVAPGNAIMTCEMGGGYINKNGTSFATAFVSGIAALTLSNNPLLQPDEIRNIMLNTATDITGGESSAGWDKYTGYGRVSAYDALLGGVLLPYPPGNAFCEQEVNPNSVSDKTPEFSWVFSHEYSFHSQNAYQILVSSNLSNLDIDVGDMWDSNEVISDASVGVSYAGSELQDFVTYYWKVRTWATQNSTSSYSDSQTFHMIGENIPPAAITDFVASSSITEEKTILTWTSPGDDGTQGTIDAQFQIKYSSDSNTNPDNAQNQVIVSSITSPGTLWLHTITDLNPLTTYYFWIRTSDEVPNWSTWSDTEAIISGEGMNVIWTSTITAGISSIAWGDFDNDGYLDFAVGYQVGSNNRVFRNNRNDTFTLIWTSSESEFTRSIEWGDFDNDGDLDLACGNGNADRVYRNNGDNTFTAVWESPELDDTRSIAWGDYDNDGYLDLAIGNWGDSDIIYRNNGNSTFSLTWESNEEELTSCIEWGDYDNDGDLDLAVASWDGSNRVYQNKKDNVFIPVWNSVETDRTSCIAWGDYDNDGDLDLAVANWDYNRPNRVYQNNGDNTFTAVWGSQESENNSSIAWGDYDNDGDLDLVVGYDHDTKPNRIYRNNGDNVFSMAWSFPALEKTEDIEWGDYDNDGDLDILVGYVNLPVQVFQSLEADYGNGNTAPSAPAAGFSSLYSSENGLSLQWEKGSDVETSGQNGLYYNLRIATSPLSDNLNAYIVSTSSGANISPSFGNYSHGYTSNAQPGFILTNFIENLTYYWQVRTIDTGFKTSNWSAQQEIYVPNTAPLAITDLVATNYGVDAGELQLTWTAPGRVEEYVIRFSTISISTANWNSSYYIDNEPDPSSYGKQENMIITGLIADTTYYFAIKSIDESLNMSEMSNVTSDFVLGEDIVPTGKITSLSGYTDYQVVLQWTAPGDDNYTGDVTNGMWHIAYSSDAMANPETAEYSLEKTSSWIQGQILSEVITGLKPRTSYYFWIKTLDESGANWSIWSDTAVVKSGIFRLIQISGAEENYVNSLAWGDYDNDGDLDLAVANDYEWPSRVYQNNGDNTFTPVWESMDMGGYYEDTMSIAWGDYDNDGYLDLVFGNMSEPNRVYRNNGDNTFVAIWESEEDDVTSTIAWGDCDNDGDLDMAVGNSALIPQYNPNRIYRNNGDNTFTLIWSFSIVEQTDSLAWGDYDNDGYLDLAVDNYLHNRVYKNNGDNTFSTGLIFDGAGGGVAWGDYDNDGDLDLAVGLDVFKNEGNGTFTLIWSCPDEHFWSFNSSWGDYDNDGDLDLVSGSYDDEAESYLCRNNGDDTFSFELSFSKTKWTKAVILGDYDNDGDLDMLEAREPDAYEEPLTLYYSFEADYGNANSAPTAPSSGFSSAYSTDEERLEFRWDAGIDNGSNPTSVNGLYYDIRVAAEPISDSLRTWIVSPSTGLGATPFMGNYPHGFVSSATQPGLNIKPFLSGVTYYWQVRTIDTGFMKSDWSNENTYYHLINDCPGVPLNPLCENQVNPINVIDLTPEFTWTFSDSDIGDTQSAYKIIVSTSQTNLSENMGDMWDSGCVVSTSTWAEYAGSMLNGGNTYYWKVNTWDNWDSSGPYCSFQVFNTRKRPASITDLAAETGAQIQLTWTAPDNGFGERCGSYIVKYSTTGSIQNNTAFNNALTYNQDWTPTLPPYTETKTITGLIPNTTYWFSIESSSGAAWSVISDTGSAYTVSSQFVDSGNYIKWQEHKMSLGDYDNDGDLDLAVVGRYYTEDKGAKIYRNDNGVFIDISAGLIEVWPGASLSWGDYDNDGDLDLVIVGYTGSEPTTKIYRNENGIFNDIAAGIEGVYYSPSVSWGDYDNDGDLDLAISGDSYSGYITRIYKNSDGNFIDIEAGLIGLWECCLGWGDYDNDGDLDLAVGGLADLEYVTKIYRNDSGIFVDAGYDLQGFDYCSLSWGDYDNDGDLDLALSGENMLGEDNGVIYRNDNGSFMDIGLDLLGVGYYLAWGDYDNDGDLDIIFNGCSVNDRTGAIIFNNYNGSFSDSEIVLPGNWVGGVCWGDYDSDGDLDLVLSAKRTGQLFVGPVIYKSLSADYGNINSKPDAPGGLSSSYSNNQMQLRWNHGTDNGPGATPQKGLHYNVRVATEPITDNISKWIVSPSTGAGVGSCSSQHTGNYPHGFCVAESTQPGVNLNLLNKNATYYWQVQAIDAGLGKSLWSTADSLYISLNIPPNAPVNPLCEGQVNPVNITNCEPIFSWTFSDSGSYDAQSAYRLLVSTSATTLSSNTGDTWDTGYVVSSSSWTEYNGSMLNGGNTYYWKVMTWDNWDSSGSYCSAQTFQIINNVPNPPLNPLCDGQANPIDVIELTPEYSWIFSDPDDGNVQKAYRILVSASSSTLMGNIGDMWGFYEETSINNITYAGSPLSWGVTYYWKIMTWDTWNSSGPYCDQQTFIMAPQPPPPTGLTVNTVTKHTIEISWQADEDNTKYDVEESTDGVKFNVAGSSITGTLFVDSGLKAGTTYWYRVFGYNEYGVKSNSSEINQMTEQVDEIDPLITDVINANNGNIKVYVTSGTFAAISYIKVSSNTTSAMIIEANEKLVSLKNIETTVTEFNAYTITGVMLNEEDFNKDMVVELHYDEASIQDAGIDESTLKIYVLDEEDGIWEDIDEDKQLLDPINDYVSATIEHFSVYCLMGAGGELDILNVANFPNPFAEGTVFTFELTVAADVNISIFTIGGRRVRVLEADGLDAGYNELPDGETWKGTDSSNSSLANGTYIYIIKATSISTDEAVSKTGKIVIMR